MCKFTLFSLKNYHILSDYFSFLQKKYYARQIAHKTLHLLSTIGTVAVRQQRDCLFARHRTFHAISRKHKTL